MDEPLDADLEHLSERRRAMEQLLGRAIAATGAYLVLAGAGSIVAALLMLETTRSTHLARVAALSLAGGALGATVRALYELMARLEEGLWELSDGSIVQRSLRRRARARELFFLVRAQRQSFAGTGAAVQPEQEQQPTAEEEHPAPRFRSEAERDEYAAQEQERVSLGLARVEYDTLRKAEDKAADTRGFGLLDLPWMILLPLLGAALGLVAFAGLVGGFLIASGSTSPSYSPAGLLFISALAGMFAPNFIASLARAADAIFGKMTQHEANAPKRD
jgi:hypothetical protein